jgi:lipopolysaccharide transport system ATP-binding protein
MLQVAIDIVDLRKRYALQHQQRADSLKDWLSSFVPRATSAAKAEAGDEEFWALGGVSLQVQQGQCLALIGKNGSGKSTLLKILSRVIPPTSGHIVVSGRVAALLEVGTGFHPDLTGRENIFLNGAMLGCPARSIRQRLDLIVSFSGVERFLDTPVKHYSTGMYVRLAYAVAAHVDAEILVIDEVLAVGDADFQRQCYAHLESQFGRGTTGIIVSHNSDVVRRLASHVAWLEGGRLREYGSVGSGILERYESAASGAADLE